MTELDRANLIIERILYTPQQAQTSSEKQDTPTAEQPSAPIKKRCSVGTRLARYQSQLLYLQRQRGPDDGE